MSAFYGVSPFSMLTYYVYAPLENGSQPQKSSHDTSHSPFVV
ncbi:hypothetical protein [Campylobacter sp. 19-13652]|nr:hypothetical protein [Campylobacter sp. 19-13652]